MKLPTETTATSSSLSPLPAKKANYLSMLLPFEMIEAILEFVPYDKYLTTLNGFFPPETDFKNASSTYVEMIQRSKILVSTVEDLQLLNQMVPINNLVFPNPFKNKIKVIASSLSDFQIATIQKFHTVELEGVDLQYTNLYTLLCPKKSQIVKLVLHKCKVSIDPTVSGLERIIQRGISQCLKTLTILFCTNVIELVVLSKFDAIEKIFVCLNRDETYQMSFRNTIETKKYSKLIKAGGNIKVNEIGLIKKLFLPTELHLQFLKGVWKYNSLTLQTFEGRKYSPKLQNVKKLTLLEGIHYLNISVLSNFEEVVISDVQIMIPTNNTLEEIPNYKLQKITIMTTRRNQFITKILQYRLRILFPQACIGLELLPEQLLISNPSKNFRTIEAKEFLRLKTFRRVEIELKKLDRISNQCIYRNEEELSIFFQSFDEILKAMSDVLDGHFGIEQLTKDSTKNLSLKIGQLEIIDENLFDNEIALNNFYNSIKNYETIIGQDAIIERIKANYQQELKTENLNRKLLEDYFTTMKYQIEFKGYRFRLLLKK